MPISAPTQLASYQGSALAAAHTTAASAAAVPVGNLVVIVGDLDGWTATTITDTAGNTYTRTVNFAQGGATTIIIAWTVVTTAITTSTTFTINAGGAAGCTMSVQAFSGIAASPLDQSAAAGVSAGTDLNSGNTPALTGTDDLLIGGCALHVSTLTATPEVVSPVWNAFASNPLTSTGASGVRRSYGFYREITGGGTPRFDVTTSAANTSSAAGIVAFKAITAIPITYVYKPMTRNN